MWRKIIISVLIVAILLIASCVYFSNPPSVGRPGITSDNSEGAIVIYEVYKFGRKCDCYVQRISAEGDFLWGEKGILIGSGHKNQPGMLVDLHAVGDGLGGAIVIWPESLPQPKGKPPYPRYLSKTHVLKVDSEGNIQWQRDIPSIEEAIADGSGGAIIIFSDFYEELSVLKIDSEGNSPWGKDGVSLGLHGYSHCGHAASDNLGGVIGVQDITGEDIISAQRVESEGNILWQRGGVQVFVGCATEPQVASDGTGGAIIVYSRLIPSEGTKGCSSYSDPDIYAQRVDAEGNILWQPDGVPICVGPSLVEIPQIVDDGAGGAIIIWRSHLPEWRGAIYAQRIDSRGNILWQEDGVKVCEGGVNIYPFMVSDSSGGAILIWSHGDEIRGQRLDATGRKLWGPKGAVVSFPGRHSPVAISEDGYGGVFISWVASKFIDDETLSYVQRIDAEGNRLWGEKGILLNG